MMWVIADWYLKLVAEGLACAWHRGCWRCCIFGLVGCERKTENGERKKEKGVGKVLTALGEKIFIDRYALKEHGNFGIGDKVLANGQLGRVLSVSNDTISIKLESGEQISCEKSNVAKPIETPERMFKRELPLRPTPGWFRYTSLLNPSRWAYGSGCRCFCRGKQGKVD